MGGVNKIKYCVNGTRTDGCKWWHVSVLLFSGHFVKGSTSINMQFCLIICVVGHKILMFEIYRVSQEECARLRESVPYVKVYRYNPKHLYPKLNGYGDYFPIQH